MFGERTPIAQTRPCAPRNSEVQTTPLGAAPPSSARAKFRSPAFNIQRVTQLSALSPSPPFSCANDLEVSSIVERERVETRVSPGSETSSAFRIFERENERERERDRTRQSCQSLPIVYHLASRPPHASQHETAPGTDTLRNEFDAETPGVLRCHVFGKLTSFGPLTTIADDILLSPMAQDQGEAAWGGKRSTPTPRADILELGRSVCPDLTFAGGGQKNSIISGFATFG